MDSIEDIIQVETKRTVRRIYEEFVEELIENSTIIEVETINYDSILQGVKHIRENGFDREEINLLSSSLQTVMQFRNCIQINEFDFYSTVPDNTVILFDEDTVRPSPPELIKPGIIVQPEGIVTLKSNSQT